MKKEIGTALANVFFSCVDELFLSQIVTIPTRGQNILDLCFIKNEDVIVQTQVQDTNMSDHKLVVIDTHEINSELTSINWQEEFAERSIEEMNLILLEKIRTICR